MRRRPESHPGVDNDPATPIHILLLTQPACDFCDHAKDVLTRLASEFNLSVHEIPFGSSEGQRLAVAHGAIFAPAILIDGELVSYGRPSERRLRRLLGSRAPTPHDHIDELNESPVVLTIQNVAEAPK